MKQYKVWIMLMCFVSIVTITANTSLGDSFRGEASIEMGYATCLQKPYVTVSLLGSKYGLTTYGSIKVDVTQANTWRTFGPLRSTYTIGLNYIWRRVELGWYHQCTHRGDYATSEIWQRIRRPNEDNFYIKFTIREH